MPSPAHLAGLVADSNDQRCTAQPTRRGRVTPRPMTGTATGMALGSLDLARGRRVSRW